MKKNLSPFNYSIQWMGILGMFCIWTSCSSPKLAQNTLSSSHHITLAQTDDAPQAAQTQSVSANLPEPSEAEELMASNDPAMLPAAVEKVNTSLSGLALEKPALARKIAKAAGKLEKQAVTASDSKSLQASTSDKKAAEKLLAKAEKKFDILKAKKAEAAQANSTLVALGALLAIVGLVLVLATSGTAATVGLISLVIGVVLLIISLLS